MKFNPMVCPRCGKIAKGTREALAGVALLEVDPVTGEAEYDGYTEIWWDGQQTVVDLSGRYRLLCDEGHEWAAEME